MRFQTFPGRRGSSAVKAVGYAGHVFALRSTFVAQSKFFCDVTSESHSSFVRFFLSLSHTLLVGGTTLNWDGKRTVVTVSDGWAGLLPGSLCRKRSAGTRWVVLIMIKAYVLH